MYILKSKYKGLTVNNFNKPLEDITQEEISRLYPHFIAKYWKKETPKKKKD